MHKKIRVVILTFNCEEIIEATLAQARQVDPRPFVVDSFSRDDTLVRVGESAEIVQREFRNYADQRNWAIEQVAPHAEWQLHLDADEVLDKQAVQSILQVVQAGELARHSAFMIQRVDYFMGRQLRHSGLNPWHLRLFRSNAARCEERLYDQHFVSNSSCGRLPGFIHDRNSLTLAEWTTRHNRWSDLEVVEALTSTPSTPQDERRTLNPNPLGDPRERTRWVKRLYYRLPTGLRPLLYFVARYVFRLGFLDGREGLYFALLQGLWFRVLIDAKIDEATRRRPVANVRR